MSSLRPDDPLQEVVHAMKHGSVEELLDRGADRDWVGHDGLTPLDAARRSEAAELADWLVAQGARSAQDAGAG